ncbi:Leucine-rich repeat [Dillenia turbinata]|uniref:Leucine-rich repeat n=1 Tax=Dillenia turbinata TaxID=194707 RepID=A0AAN8ZCU5_9MAGN
MSFSVKEPMASGVLKVTMSMEKLQNQHSLHLLLLIFIFSVQQSLQLQPSQHETLLKLQKLILNKQQTLNAWDRNEYKDFCISEEDPFFHVDCYEDSITQLHINGQNGSYLLPNGFYVDAFFDILSGLTTLKVLSLVSLGLEGSLPGKIGELSSLEILNVSNNQFTGGVPLEVSKMKNLQTFILDHNLFDRQVPNWLKSLPGLTVLSLKNNSFSGSLPNSLTSLESLRILDLSMNNLSGEVPDFSNLTNLQVLDIADNNFGSSFPSLHRKLISIVLRNNRFRSGLPGNLSLFHELQRLDISANEFVGPFLPSLLFLPSINYLDVSENKLTGMLFNNMTCNNQLVFVNLSSNLLTGDLPSCLVKGRVVSYEGNCLSNGTQWQNPSSFCHKEALAVKFWPSTEKKKRVAPKAVVALSMVGGIAGAVVFLGIGFLVAKRRYVENRIDKTRPERFIMEKVSNVYISKLVSDARYITQTKKLGALGLPSYRTFALEELKEATNNFDTSSYVGQGSCGQVHRGKLADGSILAIRTLDMRKKRSTQAYMHHIEMISKLRHCHLASALGHCFELYPDESNVTRIYLIFEFAQNGTLREWISGLSGKKLNWTQRLAAAIGATKGLQFLHTGVVPGVFSNNLKITDVLLDLDFQAKISSYNHPLLAEIKQKVVSGGSPTKTKENVHARLNNDKSDVYDIGKILLEVIIGRTVISDMDIRIGRDMLQVSISADDAARRSIMDPAIQKECSEEALKTIFEICVRCLSSEPTERPSVEDILWNLQFAAQLQDSWKVDPHSNQESPLSHSQEN